MNTSGVLFDQESVIDDMIPPEQSIIVIGASAGGVEALKHVVHDLSPDLPAALFIVLHIGAQPSILPDILRNAGPLPVAHAIDGAPIESSRIYVAPPDHHLLLAPGHVHVTRGPKENNSRPALNPLFRTAATTYGNRVVGVVLTGNLNDGAAGLWEIKRHGGVTIVQDPKDAPFPSMPQSALESVEIDYCLPLSHIPSLLDMLAHRGQERKMRMETAPQPGIDNLLFSGLTCPECRGPMWEKEYGSLKEFRCRVGHVYSFESLLEQHAVTSERTLWMAILALEEEVVLMRRAAQSASGEDAQAYEVKAGVKEKRAATIREMLTQSDLSFGQSRHSA